jgi:hypothetical protein
VLEKVSNDTKAIILDNFLDRYLEPAFGSLSKTEIDMLVLELLEQIGEIDENINPYTLSKKLKISLAKASNLLYNRSLRKKYKDKDFNEMIEHILLNRKYKVHKGENGWLLLQIENPLLLEYIKNKIQELGYIQDDSFSKKIIKLTEETFIALIENCISKERKSEILKKLNEPNTTFKELIIGVIKETAEQRIGKYGVALAEKVFNLKHRR